MKGKSLIIIFISFFLIVLFLYSNNSSETGVIISEVITLNLNLMGNKSDEYYDLIELYNSTNKSINLFGYGLSDNLDKPFKWTFGDVSIQPGEYLIVYASNKDTKIDESDEIHTNFKLKSSGEKLLFSHANGSIIQTLLIPEQDTNMSYAFIGGKYQSLLKGTPGKRNDGIVIENLNTFHKKFEITASKEAGIYNEPILLKLKNDSKYDMFYTVDGTDPTNKSNKYENNIYLDYSFKNPLLYSNIKSTYYKTEYITNGNVNKATVVKARLFDGQVPLGEMFVGTYFILDDIDNKYKFDVISLSTDAENLFSGDDGIYVVGDEFKVNASRETDGGTPANYNQRGIAWERQAHVEFFTPNGEKYYSQDIGLRIFGGWSRASAKKSFKLFAREEYGNNGLFEYTFFDDVLDNDGDEINIFNRLVLRSGANDYSYALIRDVLTDSLLGNTLDYQGYKPVILYLNGEYWGIYHLREQMDERYISSHYKINEKDISVLGFIAVGLEVTHGEEDELKRFNDFLDWVEQNDMNDDNNFSVVNSYMDIENFMNYYITQIYINNMDWPSNNSRIWRYTEANSKEFNVNNLINNNDVDYDDGRYRYLLYDTEFSFGLYEGPDFASHNSFKFLNSQEPVTWANPNWSTVFFRKFMENESFSEKFLVRLSDYLNSRFEKKRVLSNIDIFRNWYKPEMKDYINRWQFSTLKTLEDWSINKLGELEEFVENRGDNLYKHAVNFFELNGTSSIIIKEFDGGSITVNQQYEIYDITTSNEIIVNNNNEADYRKQLEFDGVYFHNASIELEYFSDFPIELEITERHGYTFKGWKVKYNNSDDNNFFTNKKLIIRPHDDLEVRPIFEE